jgi:hypothetical protein
LEIGMPATVPRVRIPPLRHYFAIIRLWGRFG